MREHSRMERWFGINCKSIQRLTFLARASLLATYRMSAITSRASMSRSIFVFLAFTSIQRSARCSLVLGVATK